jgi:hypothetical protein
LRARKTAKNRGNLAGAALGRGRTRPPAKQANTSAAGQANKQLGRGGTQPPVKQTNNLAGAVLSRRSSKQTTWPGLYSAAGQANKHLQAQPRQEVVGRREARQVVIGQFVPFALVRRQARRVQHGMRAGTPTRLQVEHVIADHR